MNELWYDDLSLKSEDIKILPIKFEYLIGRHFKKWGVYFFTQYLKGSELMKTENQESKGRSPPFKTIKQTRFIKQ